ncbi:MAG: tRNA lysidine(34) synthetase TilS [Flavobacteriaceae bacterium]|nr:MAG: tRNA lysidine(34) synthetase TilS [Flavobacteriaceae bacterium]
MLKEFKQHIESRFPELKEKKFLLACSAGVDSVVLAHLCAAADLDFAIAHCNFKLRGIESEGDEKFVENLAKNLHKEYFITHFNTKEYIERTKSSLQVAARDLRYKWFKELMKKKGYAKLLTAHHADDNLETFLINLSRGTGIDGLTGIPSNTTVIARPLLKFSRKKILVYAQAEKIIWREDSSNQDTKYVRNKIRHQIVPLLKELHPTFLDNFEMTQNFLGQTAAISRNQINQLRENLFKEEGGVIRIEISQLQKLNPIEGYLHGLFREYGFTEWNDVMGLLSGMSGKEVYSNTHRLLKDREFLLLQEIRLVSDEIYEIKEGTVDISTPVQVVISEAIKVSNVAKNILYVDKKTLKYPLTLRKWKKGDYFYPLGMGGKKKLSKFFKDEKLSLISKEEQWLLCSGNDIVWVLDRRADNRFKVTDKTISILKFTNKG